MTVDGCIVNQTGFDVFIHILSPKRPGIGECCFAGLKGCKRLQIKLPFAIDFCHSCSISHIYKSLYVVICFPSSSC